MAEHYSSQHDSVESVTSAYIAAALLAAGIVAASHLLPLVVGASVVTTAAVAVGVRRSAEGDRGALLGGLRPKRLLAGDYQPDSCPR